MKMMRNPVVILPYACDMNLVLPVPASPRVKEPRRSFRVPTILVLKS